MRVCIFLLMVLAIHNTKQKPSARGKARWIFAMGNFQKRLTFEEGFRFLNI